MKVEVISTTSNTLIPSVNYYGDKVGLTFTGSVWQQKTITCSHKKVINLYVAYEITNFHGIDSYPTLTNALFGAVKLTENTDIDKYRYFGYAMAFDGKGFYSHPSGVTGRNVIIFVADMSPSVHVDNKGKYILILGKVQQRDQVNTLLKKCIQLILPKLIKNSI